MRRTVELAREAARERGPNGIAALIVRDGEILAEGVNEVHLKNDPTRHAEMVAIAKATERLGEPSLKGATLYSSLQPCEMCLAALRFSDITHVVFAARQDSVAAKYFQFPGLRIEDYVVASREPLSVTGGLMEDDVLDLYVDGEE